LSFSGGSPSTSDPPHPIHYFLLLADGLCDNALPVADFDALLVRPSRKTDDAELAAFAEVTRLGAFVWESALPAAVFDFVPVLPLLRVLEALLAALGLVTFDFAMIITPVVSLADLPGKGGNRKPEEI